MTTPAVTVSTVLTAVTAIVTEAINWISSYVGAIMDNPLILVFVVMSIVGLGVGLIRRMVRL